MERIKFNHEGKSLAEAMGIDEERKYELEAIVIYNMLIVEIMARKLFDNPKDAPRNLTTKSGVLEKILDYADTDAEAIYLTYEYCILDKKTDGLKGQMFATALAVKIKQLDLDEEKFIEWFVKKRQTSPTETE